MPPPSNIDGRLPVFVFPTSLTFYLDDQATHKQLLTIYNPYDFHLKFRVLSTDPNKYSVSDSQGFIKSQHSVDIIVHHKAISPGNIGENDKLRIQVIGSGQSRTLGKKDIPITLLTTKSDAVSSAASVDTERFEQLSTESAPSGHLRQYPLGGHGERHSSGHVAVIILVAAISLVALMLPDDGQPYDHLPYYLHLSIQQKLIAAYVLGLVTMVIFRT